jgi:hypothetical protein
LFFQLLLILQTTTHSTQINITKQSIFKRKLPQPITPTTPFGLDFKNRKNCPEFLKIGKDVEKKKTSKPKPPSVEKILETQKQKNIQANHQTKQLHM